MYLTKINLSWYGRVDYYQIHKELWTLFPNREYENRPFLYRIEKTIPGYGAEILMQSVFKPEGDTENVSIVSTKEFTPKIKKGDILRFRLLGNPVKTIKDERGRQNSRGQVKSCRVPIISVNEQKAWIERKLIDAVKLDEIIINGAPPLIFYKKREKSRGKIQPILFDGIMTVENEQNLLDALEGGIGPAKAFGCGMLSLARA
ncbi:MAG: type I-E CRISPR-associated protein Cas6/Cse3/CasE [Spirochaetales bacterium]|uniref:Type I-E CRISPR-associated protein Cas6/Cse3/CasE n=1 Tax=Candidatus Thalassospirochaeta sargassi TaxID=3119039 RepID=A0AAJ1MKD9_9SPIO|nr:type I-E CRISPR-associated protein Cas6/Cse3/CasE [Spirochaetales bacterium]